MTYETSCILEDIVSLVDRALQTENAAQQCWGDTAPIIEQYQKRRKALAKLGKKSSICASTISRFESGKLNPTLKTLVEMAEAYDCHLELVPNIH